MRQQRAQLPHELEFVSQRHSGSQRHFVATAPLIFTGVQLLDVAPLLVAPLLAAPTVVASTLSRLTVQAALYNN